MSGESPLVIPDSAERVNKGFGLTGKTEQLNTRGVNLWRSDSTVIVSGTKHLMFDNPIQTGTYTLSAIFANDKSASESLFTFYNEQNQSMGGGTIKQGGRQSKTFTLTGKAVKVLFYASSGHDSSQGVTTTIKEIQLEKGTTATPYEPYTGGKPSPSPEYPQEIKNSGKWNEGTQKYEVDVKVTGRNLFNGKLSKGKFITDDMNVVSDLVTMNTFDKPVEIEPNTDYVISANGVIWEGNINVYDENGKKIVQHFTGKFKTPSNAKYIRASISNARAPIDSKIQMEYGTAMNEFEQYHQPQTLTLTSDRPLTKWDRLVEQGGEIGWLYRSEIDDNVKPSRTDLFPYGFSLYKNQENGTYTYKSTNIKKAIGFQTSYCKQFRNKDAAYQSAELWHYSDQPSMKIQYFNTDIATVEEFIEWMESNPLTMVFKTESATFAPLPQSEQNAIRALKTYYPTTVITVDGGEVDSDIKVTYTADTKLYIDNKFAQLQKSLVNTNTQLL